MNYYFDQLSVICSGIKLTREKNKQIAWVFGDLKLSERGTHSDFVNQHKESYVSHLTNSPKQLIKKMSKDNMSEILDSNTIVKIKSMHFYCAEAISLLSFSSSSFSEDILSQIEEYSPDIKDDKKIFNEVFEMLCKSYVEFEMFEFLRFYELTFIKKYYALRLLDNLSNNTFQAVEEYNQVRRDINFLKISYDEQNLFKSYGSPMKMYTQLLEKTGTNSILQRAELLFSSAREDVIGYRESVTTQTETYILIMTSILTVIFGYNGIKTLVYDILVNLPILGNYFALHPLRWSVALWVILLLAIGYLNFNRYRANKL